MNFLSIFLGFMIVSSYKSLGQGKVSERFLTKVGSVASVFACLRFIWSFFLDLYSFKLIYSVLIIVQIMVASALPQVLKIDS
mmetsp:Transcript_21806/g.33729  ORF Transcript_21806/g.33729 Transcript_21806/m.33729 type:complete len:82 (-) Transcript_21806:478-723(-)